VVGGRWDCEPIKLLCESDQIYPLHTWGSRENRGPADGAVVVAATNLLAALVLDDNDHFWKGCHLFSFLLFIYFYLFIFLNSRWGGGRGDGWSMEVRFRWLVLYRPMGGGQHLMLRQQPVTSFKRPPRDLKDDARGVFSSIKLHCHFLYPSNKLWSIVISPRRTDRNGSNFRSDSRQV
jgi:hypothetical protein